MNPLLRICFLNLLGSLTWPLFAPELSAQVFWERDGLVAVEAEHFLDQAWDTLRHWYVQTESYPAAKLPDPDGNHAADASNGAYLEILPDTRRTHNDPLIHGENFSNEPGRLGILLYQVWFEDTGKYYVFVRTHTSGTEDNGLHVGLDGTWPESGQRLQFDGNKNAWSWESRQRTEEVHTGVPELIYLYIDKPGLHQILFSMREDGFEFDKWVMTQSYEAPEGFGPPELYFRFRDLQD